MASRLYLILSNKHYEIQLLVSSPLWRASLSTWCLHDPLHDFVQVTLRKCKFLLRAACISSFAFHPIGSEWISNTLPSRINPQATVRAPFKTDICNLWLWTGDYFPCLHGPPLAALVRHSCLEHHVLFHWFICTRSHLIWILIRMDQQLTSICKQKSHRHSKRT